MKAIATTCIAVLAATFLLGSPQNAFAECATPPGDVNGDGQTDVVDAQCAIIVVLWELGGSSGNPPPCLGPSGDTAAANTNCDVGVNVVDVQLIVLMAFGTPLNLAIDSDSDGCPDACQDGDPPIITIDTPVAFTLLNTMDDIDVSGTVQDASAVTVTVNGVAATVTGTSWTATLPAKEGLIPITAVAIDIVGNTGTATVEIRVDTTPPIIVIETPSDGITLPGVQVDVAGTASDIAPGTTIQADDLTVTVNGVDAMVSNAFWVVPDFLLQPGINLLTAVATDAAGNTSEAQISVTVLDKAGQSIVMVSGNAQSAKYGTMVPDPLFVALLDANGDTVENRPIQFTVTRGDGILSAPPINDTTVTVYSDENGLASVLFTLGQKAGAGNHRVTATAEGFVGEVEFCFAALSGPAYEISQEMGSGQMGVVGQTLPMPFVALVTDEGGNCVENAPVTFTVLEGGGLFDGSDSITVNTSSDGQVSAYLTLGPDAGTNNNVVVATFPGMTGSPVNFLASGAIPGLAAATTVSGLVLTNQDEPMPGVTAHIEGTNLSALTDANGVFVIENAPVGTIHLFIEGSTTTLPGTWPHLMYMLTTVSGQDNTVGMPIYLPVLDDAGSQVAGGALDVTLNMEGIPGASLTIFANSVTCPDGSPECDIMFTQVNKERVPMPAPMGSVFNVAWTVQPSGTKFSPPARVCLPNIDLSPGAHSEMFSFDHDLETWVSIGPATVSEDGAQICSDPGYGIVKAGWGGAPPPPPPDDCPNGCDDGNECTSDACENGACKNTPTNENGSCGNNDNECGPAKCKGGSCQFDTASAEGKPCDDEKHCTEDDKCQSGSCKGEEVDCTDVGITLQEWDFVKLKEILSTVKEVADVGPCGVDPGVSGNIKIDVERKCCEDNPSELCHEGTKVTGAVSGSLFAYCDALEVIPILGPILSFAEKFGVELSLNVGFEGKLEGKGSGGKDACTQKSETSICIGGGVGFKVELKAVGGDEDWLSASGAGSTFIGVEGCCKNGSEGEWKAAWKPLTVEFKACAVFLCKGIDFTFFEDVSLGGGTFSCPF